MGDKQMKSQSLNAIDVSGEESVAKPNPRTKKTGSKSQKADLAETETININGILVPKHRPYDQEVLKFLYAFSKQPEAVRNSIVNELPAYNRLVSMKTTSFKDVYLRQLAEERGIVYSPESPPLPPCPVCGSDDVRIKRRQSEGKEDSYKCNNPACKQNFSANYMSIAYESNCDILVWAKLLQTLFDHIPINRACKYCGIAPESYYLLRNKCFYAIELFLQKYLKLSGQIEVDIKKVPVSYKGLDLSVYDAPSGSIFEDTGHKPRSARARGGPRKQDDINTEYIAVFLAIDDSGRCLARYAGVGQADYNILRRKVPLDRYLDEVPKEDPFGKFRKERNKSPKLTAGSRTKIIADKEGAIKKYVCDYLHFDFESHVYRRDGRQIRLPEGKSHIQHCNALCGRLENFLRDCHYVSSKYLPGFLNLFMFIENTGCSDEAVAELLRIIATPNLGKPPEFYENLFSVPNYLLEWRIDGPKPHKIPNRKRLAFYLYDHIVHPEDYPGVQITMEYIKKQVRMSSAAIRNAYKELCNLQYRDAILEYYGEPPRKKAPTPTIDEIVLTIYQEWAKLCPLPSDVRPNFKEFLIQKNEQYGTSYKRTNMLAKFKTIEERGFLPPLPPLNMEKSKPDMPQKIAFEVYERFLEIRTDYLKRGEELPKNITIHKQLSDEFDRTINMIEKYINMVRMYMKKHPEIRNNE